MEQQWKEGCSMIPKVIHYCWFGGAELPELAVRCMDSWRKYCPDYQIVRWDESNFDLEYNQYVKDAYQAKKWAFISDVARLKIIYDNGGIYLDTDVELLKPIDDLLQHRAYMGIENTGSINTGLGFGAEPGMPLIGELLDLYNREAFQPDSPVSCPVVTTALFQKKGYVFSNQLQTIMDTHIYPMDYFAPINLTTRQLHVTQNTYSIHHYLGSWESEEKKKDTRFRVRCCKVFGEKIGMRIYGHCCAIKAEGLCYYLKRRLFGHTKLK